MLQSRYRRQSKVGGCIVGGGAQQGNEYLQGKYRTRMGQMLKTLKQSDRKI
jgi:hypothetical protein